MKRLLIASVVLLAGCGPQSLLTPGMSPREAVLARLSANLTSSGIPQSVASCVTREVSANLTDAEMERADRNLAAGGGDQTALNAGAIAQAKCVPR